MYPPALLDKILPGLSNSAQAHARAIYSESTLLDRVLPPGPWTNLRIDLGAQTDALPKQHTHILGWTWVAITAFGNFDPDFGGQIIFWDFGRVMRFPPGTTILVPAIVRYSITKIRPGETRYSLIHYTPTTPKWQSWPSVPVTLSKYY
ncbi:hypothetical protein C8R43DRAFT_879163 [Mycena crocata]|nr:hypothetical protein C8R43DRAFT_879163 [Mycena crocata]